MQLLALVAQPRECLPQEERKKPAFEALDILRNSDNI
jgi:hypothetical protein